MANKLTGNVSAVGSGNAFYSSWTDSDGVEYTANGNTDASTAAWACSAATVTYNAKTQLKGNQSFQGYIGKKDFKFTFSNGGVMSGTLDTEIDHHYEVSGNAKWAVE